MPRMLLAVTALLAFLVSPACAAAHMTVPPSAPPTPDPASNRYLALGDSYTIGEGVAADKRFPVELTRALRAHGVSVADPVIIARTGWTTDELSAAIDQAGTQGPFELVTLLIGVNNQYRGYSPDGYRLEFRELLRRSIGFAGGEAGHVIVISIPDWGVTPFAGGRDGGRIAQEIDDFNAINRDETAAAGARYVDVTGISRRAVSERGLLAGDRLHPSGKMYSLWVDVILIEALQVLNG